MTRGRREPTEVGPGPATGGNRHLKFSVEYLRTLAISGLAPAKHDRGMGSSGCRKTVLIFATKPDVMIEPLAVAQRNCHERLFGAAVTGLWRSTAHHAASLLPASPYRRDARLLRPDPAFQKYWKPEGEHHRQMSQRFRKQKQARSGDRRSAADVLCGTSDHRHRDACPRRQRRPGAKGLGDPPGA